MREYLVAIAAGMAFFGAMFIYIAVVFGFGLVPDPVDDNFTLVHYIAGGIGFAVCVAAGYIAGNAAEGTSLAEARRKLRSSVAATLALFVGLCAIAASIWFVLNTPVWALVIIVLLLMILSRLE